MTIPWKARGLDFSRVFHSPDMPADVARRQVESQDHRIDRALDHTLIAKAKAALESQEKVSFIQPIRNVNRTVGTMLSSEVVRRYTHAGLPDDTIHIQFNGVAGQSFGAFLARGITLDLVGEANDYVGKGLSGGRIIVRSPNDFRGFGPEQIIAGNTVLYGAIEGEAFFNGVAGERFAVRNSGAATVVEGTGDHGCEYMTGGTVVVLGQTGRNFAAGMSGGVAYVFDPDGDLASRCNLSMVSLSPVLSDEQQRDEADPDVWHRVQPGCEAQTDEEILKTLVKAHFRHTGSFRARDILADWPAMRSKFVKVVSPEYLRALGEIAARRKAQEVAGDAVAVASARASSGETVAADADRASAAHTGGAGVPAATAGAGQAAEPAEAGKPARGRRGKTAEAAGTASGRKVRGGGSAGKVPAARNRGEG